VHNDMNTCQQLLNFHVGLHLHSLFVCLFSILRVVVHGAIMFCYSRY